MAVSRRTSRMAPVGRPAGRQSTVAAARSKPRRTRNASRSALRSVTLRSAAVPVASPSIARPQNP